MRARATGWSGTRTATDGRPAVTMSGNPVGLGQHDRERPGPEALDERRGGGRHGAATRGQPVGRVDVDDQRVEGRPRLDGEDARHGDGVGRVGAEAVHGLGREGDDLAAADDVGGGGDRVGGGGPDHGGAVRSARQRDVTPAGADLASAAAGVLRGAHDGGGGGARPGAAGGAGCARSRGHRSS